ncbi:MAG: hypothetical protein MUO95_02795 [Methanoregula sp.]|nr:hypothetical protein [Methanoregula sp.]
MRALCRLASREPKYTHSWLQRWQITKQLESSMPDPMESREYERDPGEA